MSLNPTISLSAPTHRVAPPHGDHGFETRPVTATLCAVVVDGLSALTKPSLSTLLKGLVGLTLLRGGDALPLGRHSGIANRSQSGLADPFGHHSGFHSNTPGRHLRHHDPTVGLLFPAAVRPEGAESLISEWDLDQKTKGGLQRYFTSGTWVSGVRSDYVLMAPAIFISLLNAISRLINDRPLGPATPRFGGSCPDTQLNQDLAVLAPRFSQHIEAKDDLSRHFQNILLLGFQNMLQNAAAYQATPSLINLVISDPQLRAGFLNVSQALIRCNASFIQPLPGIDYAHLLTYQLADITPSITAAFITVLTAPLSPTSSQPGTTAAFITVLTAPLSPTSSQPGTTAAFQQALAATVASSQPDTTTAAEPNGTSSIQSHVGAVSDSSNHNATQLVYLAFLALLLPLLALIRYLVGRTASRATEGPDSGSESAITGPTVSFSSRLPSSTKVVTEAGFAALYVVPQERVSEIVAATREEAREEAIRVAREEAIRVAREVAVNVAKEVAAAEKAAVADAEREAIADSARLGPH